MMRSLLLFGFMHILSIATAQTMLRLPDTGQNGDYTTAWGEDSDYIRFWPYYQIISNELVIDTVTGLMWQRMDGGEMTIEEAWNYCDTLSLGGYDDWRLPTAQEGFSILNQQLNNPALDPIAFYANEAEYWWSSEYQANDMNKVWVTNAGGGVGNHPKTETISAGGTKRFHARAVRNHVPVSMIENRFQNNLDGTVTDLWTQLTWLQNPPVDTLSWEDALAFCENLNQGDCGNWRLPNIKELQSLNDESVINPSIPSNLFQIAESQKFWSSTTLANQSSKAWYLYDRFGITTYDEKILHHRVLPVRDAGTCTSIHALQPHPMILYPNPFNQHLTCYGCTLNTRITLFDAQGNFIRALATEDLHAMDIAPGLYMIKLQQGEDEEIQTIRLIKE